MATQQKIGNFTAIVLITTAVIVDGLQFVLTLTVLGSIMSTFVAIFASIGFFLWFLFLGVKYTGKNGGVKLFTMLAASVAELIPFINAIPAWTMGVVAIIITERIKDAKESGTQLDPKKLAAIARLARMKTARSNLMQAGATARAAQEQNRHPDAS